MTHWVYFLRDPRVNGIEGVRYVGCSRNPKQRFKAHLKDRGTTDKAKWVAGLMASGVSPVLEIAEQTDSPYESEVRHIAKLREAGCELTNGNDGGLGCKNPTAEVRLKLSIARKGMVRSQEIRAAMSQRLMGHKTSPETRAKIAASLRGRVGITPSAEHRAKISAANKGRKVTESQRANMSGKPMSPERRAKIAAKAKGRRPSQEARIKMSQVRKGKKFTEEHRAKLSEALRRRAKISPETRAKMSVAAKDRWIKRWESTGNSFGTETIKNL